jgi:glycosyltransferase involved in cell wall biosynthesis
MNAKPRVLVFIVAFNAERFIEAVLRRIPAAFLESSEFEAEILVIDDGSRDETFSRAAGFSALQGKSRLTVLHNPVNQGYGGNQKLGYHYAITRGYEAVVLLHGDGQYAPELLPQMVRPILDGRADVVLGSRMLDRGEALKGGMPLYKWLGNQVLTALQNGILKTRLSEFHTGYRAYRVEALSAVPFDRNSNYFDFDTDILIQLLDTRARITEIPIPTYYGDEISRVNGVYYGLLILWTSVLSRLVRMGIFHQAKFDYQRSNSHYTLKLGYPSSHRFALDRVPRAARVLDIGSGPGFMAQELSRKGAAVISIDSQVDPRAREFSQAVIEADIDSYDFAAAVREVDLILALDVIEHLRFPEAFLANLRQAYCFCAPRLIITTGNVAFLPLRIGLALGQFNYGRRGILDMTHTRLLTFSSLRRMLLECGYRIHEVHGIPAPIPLALGENAFSRAMVTFNQLLIGVSKSLFSYQMAYVVEPLPTLDMLLRAAHGGMAVTAGESPKD